METKIFDLWPEGKPLKIINGDEKQVNDYLAKIGLSSMSATTVTDAEKLNVRQDGLKLFMNNPKFSYLLKQLILPVSTFFGRDFFLVFGIKSPFNEKVSQMLEIMDDAVNNFQVDYKTRKYQNIVKDLKNEFRENSIRENEVISVLEEKFQDVYSYDGSIEFNANLNGEIIDIDQQVFGFQQYAFYKDRSILPRFAEWIKKIWDEDFGKKFWGFVSSVFKKIFALIFIIFSKLIIEYKERYASDSLYTEDMPKSIYDALVKINGDIVNVVKSKFFEGLSKKMHGKIDDDKSKQVYADHVKITIKLQFSLNPNRGFNVRLISIRGSHTISIADTNLYENDKFKMDSSYFDRGVSWFAKKKGNQLKNRGAQLLKDVQNEYIKFHIDQALDFAISQQRSVFENKNFFVENNRKYLDIMDEIKYSNIEYAIRSMGLNEEWENILNFRQKVKSLFFELSEINERSMVIKNAIEKIPNFKWCFPDFVSDEKNIISFDQLIPIHLIGQRNQQRTADMTIDDLRPINNLPPLNGKIISITGQNGGGKTALEIALINATVIAHMGYPVFAKYFQLNTKDILATVFVEKGEGSMLQLLMEKMRIVAETVKSHDHKKIVIIMDELLTGTQEASGLKIGRQFLHLLAENKCSVMFVTQITSLAQYAELELGSLSFHFNKDGLLLPGIGSGNAELLAEKVGLMQHLN